jgi:hypothetical protein
MSDELTVPFKCKIGTTNPSAKLGVEVLLNGNCIFRSDHVTDTIEFEHQITDEVGEQELQFVMTGKTAEDTEIDSDGNITKDAMLTITEFFTNDIDLTYLVWEHAEYTHNFNNTGAETKERFYSHMGCNGTVSFKFSTPIYLWLLENM